MFGKKVIFFIYQELIVFCLWIYDKLRDVIEKNYKKKFDLKDFLN